MIENASHYFARGNTAHGAHFLYKSAFQGLDKILVLTGPPGTGKSTVIRNLAESLLDRGQHVQCFHSPLRPDELDGIIATELKVGVIDEQACGGILEGVTGETLMFDFGVALDTRSISKETFGTIEELKGNLIDAYSKAYKTFATALRIHDEWKNFISRAWTS
ncbi:AAA family ATPase [Paenibacillus aestuarii]|uniref:AAA family ATPase n=1 Tax=Paenibacillus aestuarii TaxID=516965 RepID=A0ABW0KDC6_9BACL|nr:AAA family ATPase [Paenibacillus aestuarii]